VAEEKKTTGKAAEASKPPAVKKDGAAPGKAAKKPAKKAPARKAAKKPARKSPAKAPKGEKAQGAKGKDKGKGKDGKGEGGKGKGGKGKGDKGEGDKGEGDKGEGDKEEAKMEGYEPKAKPKLDEESRRLLCVRRDKRAKKPAFRRQEWFRYRKLGTAWRKPRGGDSKMRRNYKYRPARVRIGYGSPRMVRGLHPSGFEDILVHNVADLDGLDPKIQAIRIGHGVGTRKRMDIVKAAEKAGLRILNRGGD
jgi:large subunit ribosomal protein L32e